MNREAALAAAAVLLLAGCVAAPQDVETASVETDSPLLRSLGAFPARTTTADEALVLRTNASPDGGLASFWWTIPPGLVLGDEDDDERMVAFHAAPVLLEPQRAPLTRWLLMAFLPADGELVPGQLAFGAPLEVTSGNLLDGGSHSIERSLDPFFLKIRGELREGGRIGFVVAGVASDDVELALVLQPLDEEPKDKDDAADSMDDFLLATSDVPMAALPAVGRGGMHQLTLYIEGAGPFGTYRAQTGAVEVERSESRIPLLPTRQETLSTTFDSAGYAFAGTGYFASGTAGSWSVLADAHGHVAQTEGTSATIFGASADDPPIALAIGEGETGSRVELELDTTSFGFDEGLFLIHLDIDQTLTSLFGLPARAVTITGEGGIGHNGHDALLRVGGLDVRVPLAR